MPIYYSATDSRNYRLELEIVESSQDITNNNTTISYWLFLRALGSFYFQDFTSTISLSIDGVSLLNTTTQKVSLPSGNSATLLTSGTRVINHNPDGSKTIPFSASFRTNSTTTFTPIPTHTISDSLALTTIPRASNPTLNVSTQALGGSITISTNRASTAFTHTIKYILGNLNGTIATGVGASTSWTLPNELANAIPNNTSGAGSIICETYNGGVLIGTTTVAFTATVPNDETFQPTASIANVTEGAAGLGAFSVFIQNKSQLRVQSTGSGKFGSTISQLRVTIDGVHYFGADITSAIINKTGTITITLLVTDSRGYPTTITQNVTLEAYFAPRINAFSARRAPTDQDSDLSAPIDFEIAPVGNQNTRLYRIRYRIVGGSWVTLLTNSDHYARNYTQTASGVLNVNNSYEIELFVQDAFTSVLRTVTVTTAFDLVNYNASGKGIAFGKVSEGDEFDVAMKARFRSDLEPLYLKQNQFRRFALQLPRPADNAGAGRWFVALCDNSLNTAMSGRVLATGYWDWSNTLGVLEKEFGFYVAQGGTTLSQAQHRVISGVSGALTNIRISDFEVVGGQIGFYVYASNTNALFLELHLHTNRELTPTVGAWASFALPSIEYPPGIIESGSNANGSWVKYDDGTMIQYSGQSNSPTMSANVDADINLAFPLSFISTPTAHISAWPQVSWNGVFIKGQISSTTGASVRVANGSAAQQFTVSYMAIGRWK